MNTINKTLQRIFLSLFLFASLSSVSLAQGDPVSDLKSIADRLINKLKQHQTTLKNNPSMVYGFARQIVVPAADIDEMAKRVLPPQTWNSASASQRATFKREFTTLLVHTYASALANYTDETINFYPVRGGYAGKSNVTVNSQIERPDGSPISVTYRMVYKGRWKLYDLSVEGVSMLESFRSQFSDTLSQGNMESVIAQLQTHNGR
jgi:phospholipid transport system substrate-binding protein